MSTLPTVTIGGTNLTAYMQDKSLSVKRQGADVTLIDPADTPVIGDTFVVTDPTWSGTVVAVESTGYKGDHPFLKVRATNAAGIPDSGAAAFNLSDAPNLSTTFGFKSLVVNRTRNGSTDEVRATCTVFEEGLLLGNEIDITSVVEGFSAETFTILELTTEWPVAEGATYTLGLGLGDYATATTGAADGGPLTPPTLGGDRGQIVAAVKNAGCCGDCGCLPWDYSVCRPLRETFTRTVVAGFGKSEFNGTDWTVGSNGSQSSVNGSQGRMQPASGGTTATSQIMNLGFTYPLHIRFLTKIVGAGSSGNLMFWLGHYSIESGLTGTIGAASFNLKYMSGGSPALALDVQNVGDGGAGGSGAVTYPFSTTDIHDQAFWTEVVMTLNDFSIRAYLDGSSGGAYTVYPNHLGSDITLPILLEAYAQSTNPATPDWRIDTIEFLCDDPGPATGQQIRDEYVFTGDGLRSTATLQYPYARGSLTIIVDGIPQDVTETDPATGAMALAFTPIAGEIVRASYNRAPP